MEFVSWGMPPAEFQLLLMGTSLRVMAPAALATAGAASVTYSLLWVAELWRPVSGARARRRRRG
jgi:hypothetical protein